MKNHLIYLLFFLLFVSCEKENIQSGIETKISGRLSNYEGEPIVNSKVKIGEFKNRFVFDGGSTDYFSKYVDSTLTNSDGDYDFTFKTTGEGSSYKLILDNNPSDQSYFGFYDPIEIKNLGNPLVFNFNQFTKLYPCDVTINMNNILILPIRIYHETTRQLSNPEITINTVYVKRIYITKFEAQKFTLERIKPNGTYQKAVFNFPASNSIQITTRTINLTDSDFVDI